MAYEEPPFQLIKNIDGIEIRKYSEYLVAEAEVTGDRDESGSAGFKILASYIFGKNEGKHSISMTAPVIQSETLSTETSGPFFQQPMAGATSQNSPQRWKVQFMMPSKYSLESIPKPLDPNVHLKVVSEKKVAAITYSGRWTESNYQENLNILKQALEKAHLKTKSTAPLWARYNSPFTPWFLRKNEILIEIE
ncbi:MAG: SOUL family heme-binding protein [Deltaproteobacteria bacterium]